MMHVTLSLFHLFEPHFIHLEDGHEYPTCGVISAEMSIRTLQVCDVLSLGSTRDKIREAL